MKKLHTIFSLCLILLAASLLTGCADDEQQPGKGYGYLQFHIQKESTRAITEGNPLVHLADARKVKLSLRYNGRFIEQTLNLEAVSAEAAEYGLYTENIKLQSGDYQLLGYAIYGEYRSGDMPDILQVVTLEEAEQIHVSPASLTRHDLYVEAREYGTFSTRIIRLEPEVQTRAGSPIYSELFDYDDVDSVQFVLERSEADVIYREDCKVKAYRSLSDDAPTFYTDSIQVQSGQYTITHFELFNRQRRFMYAQDVEIPFQVSHFQLSQPEVGVQLSENGSVRDGIALKQIWDAMDGPSWSFHDQSGYGSNWVFTLSDGSPRPVSAWVNQVGVVTNSFGRVISLNLGAFNPLGNVPDALGELDALERLYLGEHTDDVYYTLEGVGDIHYRISPYLLSQTTDIRQHRMEIARERAFLRSLAEATPLQQALSPLAASSTQSQISRLRYATRVETGSNAPANRITGITEKIGQLENLQELYIANTLITKLPASMSQLTNVTDLELFNNPLTELDGDVFKGMENLTAVNIDRLFNLSESQINAAMDKMFQYCPKIQLLYLCHCRLTHAPSKLNLLTDLRLLDLSHNRISSMPSLLPMAPIQVILDHNQLTSLPADFCKIDDIESFSCTDNLLQEFPVVLSNLQSQYSFEKVNLSGNRIHGFQSGFQGIRCEQLFLSSNQMGRRNGESGKGYMPEEFARTKSVINYLDLAFNNIDTLRNAAIRGLSSVQAFDLSKNFLRYLPSAFNSETFPWLTGLDLSANRFEGFPANVLNVLSLTQLVIKDQGYFRDEAETQWVRTMTEWPAYLHLHASLTTVNMSGNDFREVTTFPSNLNSLNICGNPNIRMTIPADVWYRMQNGLFVLYMDKDQNVTLE